MNPSAESTIDRLIESSKLADFANTKSSRAVASYHISDTQQQPANVPMLSYGLQVNRLADAPPEALIDTESSLNNRFDILGKSGYVYRTPSDSKSKTELNEFFAPITKPPTEPTKSTEIFFQTTAGRDYKPCENLNIWRDDIITTQAPVPDRYAHVDTRQMMKTKTDTCTKK